LRLVLGFALTVPWPQFQLKALAAQLSAPDAKIEVEVIRQ